MGSTIPWWQGNRFHWMNMSSNNFFTVENEDLSRLTPQEAVEFFRSLLLAEATRIGLSKANINVPSAISVSDGGIDADVTCDVPSIPQGLIKSELTRYQIKTGKFSLETDSDIKAILFKENSKELKPRIKSCFEKAGTLVVVLFGFDNPDSEDDKLRNKFQQFLTAVDEKFSSARIEILRQNHLRSLVGGYPSLCLKLNRHEIDPYQTFKSWMQNDGMKAPYQPGEAQSKIITSIRTSLTNNDKAVHLRIVGEAGIGKTRLVLEAVSGEELAPLILYCDSASKFISGPLISNLLLDDNASNVILVLDECDETQSADIWKKLKHRGPRIKLISISHDYDKMAVVEKPFEIPMLEAEKIKSIIRSYTLTDDHLDRWADLCSGSPRVAHVIGNNLKNNPTELLKPLDTDTIWDRFIAGKDTPEDQTVKERHLILRTISLFKKFGYLKPYEFEFKAIVALIQREDASLTEPKIRAHISTLRKRKILQGDTTLYITPKALHIKLWCEWWDTYGDGFDLETFSSELPESLSEYFNEMIVYAEESKAASTFVKTLLDENGPFRKEPFLKKKVEAEFFLALTEADPESGLKLLEKVIGEWNVDKLRHFTDGRRQVIWALEKIVVWKPFFIRAANLLLALAEAENETYSDNATGVFKGLFSPGYGPVAATEASPLERLPILNETIKSESKAKKLLAIEACDIALETSHFVRSTTHLLQGLKRRPNLWMPKTWGELFDSYRAVWRLLFNSLDILKDDERQKAVQILLQRSMNVCLYANLSQMVMDSIDDLARRDYVDKRDVVATAIRVLKFENPDLSEETKKRWITIKENLLGDDYPSRMKRYVGMALFEDEEINEDGQLVNVTEGEIKKLAQESVNASEQLKYELPWLVTKEARNGYRFGYELGKADIGNKLLEMLIVAHKAAKDNYDVYFLGGYLKALNESSVEKWETQLDRIAEDEVLHKKIAELTWRSGRSDRAALRVLNLAKKGKLPIRDFEIFRLGGAITSLSESVFKQWMDYLLSFEEIEGAQIAIELFIFYYMREMKTAPPDMVISLLTHVSLTKPVDRHRYDANLLEHNWADIARKYIDILPPAFSNSLLEFILQQFGTDDTIFESHHSQIHNFLSSLIQKMPAHAWELISKHLGPPFDGRSYHFSRLLKEAALFSIPMDKVFRWVDENVEKRAWYLANFVPKPLSIDSASPAREVLIKYGERKDVRNNLMANYFTESWMGSESDHYKAKLASILQYKATETNPKVLKWIEEYVDALKKHIEKAKIEEERSDF